MPSVTDFLGVHVMHGQERLTPVIVAKWQGYRLLAVEHGMCLFDLLSGFHNSQGHEVITTAFMGSHHIVFVCQVRNLNHLPHGVSVNDITTATMGEWLSLEHGNTADVWGLCTIDPVAKVPHKIRPEDVGVGFSKHVPLLIGSHLPGFLYHVEELVLIKIPAFLHIFGTILLSNRAFGLGFVKVKFLAAFSDVVLHVLQDVVDLVLVDLLVLSELVSCNPLWNGGLV
jgi:hypothetical protein